MSERTDAPNRRDFLRLTASSGVALATGGPFFGSFGCSTTRDRPVEAAEVPRRGGLDVTLFVTADTHFGWSDGERNNRALLASLVDTLDAMPGTALPEALGAGVVAEPRGVVVAGDLTEDGHASEWDAFVDHFGLTGREGRLRFPVYETVGNHDYHSSHHVAGRVTVRHGAVSYARDFGDLRMICLGDGPDADTLDWLRRLLADTGTARPVMIYLHYPLAGPHSTTSDFGKSFRRWQLLRALAGFNVVGIFHGHSHATGAYRMLGIDVYNVGAAKHRSNAFSVVRITDDRLSVATWNWLHQRWWWVHDKPINASGPITGDGRAAPAVARPEQLLVYDMPAGQRPALIPYPLVDKRRG